MRGASRGPAGSPPATTARPTRSRATSSPGPRSSRPWSRHGSTARAAASTTASSPSSSRGTPRAATPAAGRAPPSSPMRPAPATTPPGSSPTCGSTTTPTPPASSARIHALSTLYFGQPEGVEPLEGALREEVAGHLAALGHGGRRPGRGAGGVDVGGQPREPPLPRWHRRAGAGRAPLGRAGLTEADRRLTVPRPIPDRVLTSFLPSPCPGRPSVTWCCPAPPMVRARREGAPHEPIPRAHRSGGRRERPSPSPPPSRPPPSRRPPATARSPTFQEFVASTFQDEDRGYIVNGDEPATTRAALRQFYDAMVAEPDTDVDGLIVNRVNGQDDKWSASQALNLTYCVSTKFGADYAARRRRPMAAGAGQWEAASSEGQLRLRARAGRQLHHAQLDGALLRRADEDHAVHRPRVLPQHARSPRATSSSTPRACSTPARGPRATSWRTSWATPSASATSTPAPRPAPASRTTTGVR